MNDIVNLLKIGEINVRDVGDRCSAENVTEIVDVVDGQRVSLCELLPSVVDSLVLYMCVITPTLIIILPPVVVHNHIMMTARKLLSKLPVKNVTNI